MGRVRQGLITFLFVFVVVAVNFLLLLQEPHNGRGKINFSPLMY